MDIELTEPQSKVFIAKKRVVGVVAGMGSGKTDVLIIRMISDLVKYRRNLLYCAPTYPLIRDIFYPKLSEFFVRMGIGYKINKKEGSVNTSYGKIITKSMSQPEGIVGFEVLNAYIDEIDILSTDKAKLAFDKVAGRLRMQPRDIGKDEEHVNQIFLASTPEGYKFMYNTFVKDPVKNSEFIQMSTYSNPHLKPGYIEGLKSQFPENRLKAYLLGKFVNLTFGNVYSFDKDLYVRKNVPDISKTETIYIGQDFNVGKMASVIIVRRKNTANENVWLVVDELTRARDTADLIYKLNDRFKSNPKIMYPDATGMNKNTNSMSRSDHSILRENGFILMVNKTNPFVRDRIISVNNALEKGKIFISDKCKQLIESLSHQVYDKDGYPSKDNDLDHIADAFGYFVAKEEPVATSIVRYNAVNHL